MKVRPGEKQDLSQVFELIKELAEYEGASDQVTNSVERLEQDGFGPNPVFGFLVAEISKSIVGLSLYYYRYSTWKGKRLYLPGAAASLSATSACTRKAARTTDTARLRKPSMMGVATP